MSAHLGWNRNNVTWATPGRNTQFENSNRWCHQGVWLQMGVHDQQQESSNSCSVLRLRCGTTNLVSNKVSRTRIWNNTEWTTNNQTHKWIWISIEATTWPILLDSEDNRNTSQHTTGYSKNRARHQGNNLTSHDDSNRSQVGDTQQRHLDLQQPRFSCETTQEATTSNIHTWQTNVQFHWTSLKTTGEQ